MYASPPFPFPGAPRPHPWAVSPLQALASWPAPGPSSPDGPAAVAAERVRVEGSEEEKAAQLARLNAHGAFAERLGGEASHEGKAWRGSPAQMLRAK